MYQKVVSLDLRTALTQTLAFLAGVRFEKKNKILFEKIKLTNLF